MFVGWEEGWGREEGFEARGSRGSRGGGQSTAQGCKRAEGQGARRR